MSKPTPQEEELELRRELQRILKGYGIRDEDFIKKFNIESLSLAKATHQLQQIIRSEVMSVLDELGEEFNTLETKGDALTAIRKLRERYAE